MEWKSLEMFPNYQFSDTGHVKKFGKPARVHLNGGYPTIILSNGLIKKRIKVHHVIAELFIGPRPEGLLVRHLDDDRENNCVSNLAYGTYKDNSQDAIRNGKVPIGNDHWSRINPEKVPKGQNHYSITNPEKLSRRESHWKSKLTEKEIYEIKNTQDYYGCVSRLAEKFGVNRATISRVRNGKTWCI